MAIFLRLDERLVHGQVVTTWINFLGVTHVLVANDEASESNLQSQLLKMSIPDHVKSMVLPVDRAISILNDKRCELMKILAICGNPKDTLTLVDHVSAIKDVNLANYGFQAKPDVKNKKFLTSNLAVDEEDLGYIKEIQSKVENCYCQVLSNQPKKPINY
jgi:mannose/fructose/N-acetylgalactosamine-specific phosphotransferase system component IIB